MNRDHPIARHLIQAQRKSAKTYTCPLCDSTYHHEARIYDHGVNKHPEYLAEPGLAGKPEAVREEFARRAIERTQQKAIPDHAAAEARHRPGLVSGSRKPSVRSVDDEVSGHYSPIRPAAVGGNSQASQKHIHEFGRLSLDQATPRVQKPPPTTLNNPRKRGPESESRSAEALTGDYKNRSMVARTRHGHNVSGSVQVDATRQGPPDYSDFKRGPSDTKQLLYNPNTDPVKINRQERHNGYYASNPWRGQNPHVQSAGPGPELPEKEITYIHSPFSQEKSHASRSPREFEEEAEQPYLSERDRENYGTESPDRVPSGKEFPAGLTPDLEMLLQPETRPISHEQLVVEVKGIYAGLVMVEAKCIDIDEKQSAAAQEKDLTKRPELKNDQWQSLIALHKQLLHEHHDFFLASQHPSASGALSRLAAKYSMPARMWRHGIHAFLEVLRHRLPESLEHMLAFIYIAYSMMALLYETVPTFEDTWIECLGDLGRYRMAIEDDEPRDREVWSNVAKFWYNKASDNAPDIGRLYHHRAILARPYTLEQLSLYTRSLTCVVPFESAKGSIMTLFNPVLRNKNIVQRRPFSLETLFIKAHALLFTHKLGESFEPFTAILRELGDEQLFEKYIIKTSSKFKELGVFIATSAIAALFQYGYAKDGESKSSLRLAFEDARKARPEAGKIPSLKVDESTVPASTDSAHSQTDNVGITESKGGLVLINHSLRLAALILRICLRRPRDSNTYPLVHVYLGFIWSLIIVSHTCRYFAETAVLKDIEKHIPWLSLCFYLNVLAEDTQISISKVQAEEFPQSITENGRLLPEDYVLRGQLYTLWYYPKNWFTAAIIDEDERSHDPPSMKQPRKERMLWLGHQIAAAEKWIRFDQGEKCFSVTDYVTENIDKADFESALREQDVMMSEGGSVTEDAPQSTRLASSELTRASTPTDPSSADKFAQPLTPKAVQRMSSPDDVPMIDLSPKKEGQVNSPKQVQGSLKAPASTVLHT